MMLASFYNLSGESKSIFLYDTFDGMVEPSSEFDDPIAKEMFHNVDKIKETNPNHIENNKWCYGSIDHVKNVMGVIPYDQSKIKFIKGDICETLDHEQNIPKKICILRLDTDWYDSTKKELDILFPLVEQGGYIIIDDYYAWKGSKNATDQFLENNKNCVEIIEGAPWPEAKTCLTGGPLVLKRL